MLSTCVNNASKICRSTVELWLFSQSAILIWKQNDYLTIPKSKQATHIHLTGYLSKNALCVSVISS